MRHLYVLAILAVSTLARAADRPNIIFMMADDQGWNGLSVPMHPDVPGSKNAIIQTPCLEKFAAQGMRFSAAYSPAPVCSPTRISIQTGKSPAQLHWTKAAPAESGRKLIEPRLIKSISQQETTIGELLKGAGYATAHYGKWHISGGGPEKHGYDESDGDTGNEHAFQYKDPNPVDIFGMAKKAAAFMEKSRKAGKPFYIQLSWNALHAAENANKATLAKYEKLADGKNSARAAIAEDLDTGVGALLKSIDQLGLAGNTFVIYTSDNGGGGGGGAGRAALNGGKGDVYEGGIRVPFIIRGPGIQPNSWSHTRIVGYDMLPTFCDWAGVPSSRLPKGIEGGSIVPVLKNDGKGKVTRPREELVFHFPHYQGDTPHSAIISGDLKLIRFYEDNRVALYDLGKDLRERTDLASKMPTETARLKARLADYLTQVNAQLPTANPDYDPSKPPPPSKRGGMGGGGGNKKPGANKKKPPADVE